MLTNAVRSVRPASAKECFLVRVYGVGRAAEISQKNIRRPGIHFFFQRPARFAPKVKAKGVAPGIPHQARLKGRLAISSAVGISNSAERTRAEHLKTKLLNVDVPVFVIPKLKGGRASIDHFDID